MDASKLQLESAKDADEVKMIYQVNRKHYDKLKEVDAREHVNVLGLFKQRKEELNGV
jgi:hypothetical protein